jgi:PTS system nitrogen regulatory IIA component
MKLNEALVSESIEPTLKARTKDELFEEMTDLLMKNPALKGTDRATVQKALVERERTATTGVGREVAIPHGKIMGLKRIVGAIGVAPHGIEYGSVDGLDVRFVVAILAPPEESHDYLRILAKVARLLSDTAFRESVLTAGSAEGIYARIEDIEQETPVEGTGEQVLLIFELVDADYFDPVVEYFTEVGATSATVMDARNVEGFLTKVPLFADFSRVFTEGQEFGHIFLLVIDKGLVDRFIEGIEEIIGELDDEGRGIAITIPISESRGRPSRIEF